MYGSKDVNVVFLKITFLVVMFDDKSLHDEVR